jgi:hypothetical protein
MRSGEADHPEPGTRHWRQLNAGQQVLVSWFWAALLVSGAFVLAIPVGWYLPDFMPRLVLRMNLTQENNLGAWWSGVLLFMLAVHAYDASVAVRERARTLAVAWTILTAILMFFSADEIGSMHERLGILGNPLGLGSWGPILVLGAVIGTALLYALRLMWQGGREDRGYVVALFVGFALLGSVAIQEVIEHAVEWGTGAAIWIRAAIEEGTELLGMVVLLRVIVGPSVQMAGQPASSGRRLFNLLPDHALHIFVILILLVPVFTVLTMLIDDHRGRLADWLAVVTFLTAGLAAASRLMSRDTTMRARLVCIAWLCLLASSVPMWIGPDRIIMAGDLDISGRLAVLGVIGGLALVTTATISRDLIPMASVVGACLVLAPVLGSDPTYVFLMTQVAAVLVLGVTYIALEAPRHRPAGERLTS